MSSLADVFRVLNRMRADGFRTMPDRLPDEMKHLLARKRDWHRARAGTPLQEKVRILLELQRQDLPLIARQRPLRPWERPWDVTP